MKKLKDALAVLETYTYMVGLHSQCKFLVLIVNLGEKDLKVWKTTEYDNEDFKMPVVMGH